MIQRAAMKNAHDVAAEILERELNNLPLDVKQKDAERIRKGLKAIIETHKAYGTGERVLKKKKRPSFRSPFDRKIFDDY